MFVINKGEECSINLELVISNSQDDPIVVDDNDIDYIRFAVGVFLNLYCRKEKKNES